MDTHDVASSGYRRPCSQLPRESGTPIRSQAARLSAHGPGAGYGRGGHRWRQIVSLKEEIQKNLEAKQRGTRVGKAVRRLKDFAFSPGGELGDLDLGPAGLPWGFGPHFICKSPPRFLGRAIRCKWGDGGRGREGGREKRTPCK